MNANTININVTNISNRFRVDHTGSKRKFQGSQRHFAVRSDRPPRLLRYCSTCGLLDQGVVAGMSNGERCVESARVIGYAAKGLCSDVGSMAGNVVSAGFGIAKGTVGLVAALFGKNIF